MPCRNYKYLLILDVRKIYKDRGDPFGDPSHLLRNMSSNLSSSISEKVFNLEELRRLILQKRGDIMVRDKFKGRILRFEKKYEVIPKVIHSPMIKESLVRLNIDHSVSCVLWLMEKDGGDFTSFTWGVDHYTFYSKYRCSSLSRQCITSHISYN